VKHYEEGRGRRLWKGQSVEGDTHVEIVQSFDSRKTTNSLGMFWNWIETLVCFIGNNILEETFE
jgi:hypothetical protein